MLEDTTKELNKYQKFYKANPDLVKQMTDNGYCLTSVSESGNIATWVRGTNFDVYNGNKED